MLKSKVNFGVFIFRYIFELLLFWPSTLLNGKNNKTTGLYPLEPIWVIVRYLRHFELQGYSPCSFLFISSNSHVVFYSFHFKADSNQFSIRVTFGQSLFHRVYWGYLLNEQHWQTKQLIMITYSATIQATIHCSHTT